MPVFGFDAREKWGFHEKSGEENWTVDDGGPWWVSLAKTENPATE
jgi:hypothetical protein